MTNTIGGRYRIIKHLSGGGFGQTFLAEDTHLPNNPSCVVKQLMPLIKDESGNVVLLPKNSPNFKLAHRLFQTEAQVLYKLGEDKQIPKLLAHFEEEREFYLVEEFIEGHELDKEIIAGQRWNEAQVIDLLTDILTPLAFVHQHKVIHRDLKPANLMRRKQDGKIVLIDFGAVKEIISQTTYCEGQPQKTIAIGTLGYTPCEQAKGQPTLSSDVYAVGIIAIQALTGLYTDKLPEDPATGDAWYNHVQISPKLAEILNKMVRWDFRQRYQSAAEALQAVRTLKNPQKIVVNQKLATTVLSENKQKIAINPRFVATLFTLLIAIVVGAFAFTRSLDVRSTKDETPAKKEIPAF